MRGATKQYFVIRASFPEKERSLAIESPPKKNGTAFSFGEREL
jgi:hypothetical protein